MPREKWFAVAVRPNRERAVANFLKSKKYEIFLPLYRDRRVWSDRIKEVQTPLFPGYVFVRFDIEDRSTPVITTPGVTRIVGVAGRPVPVEDSEIDAVRRILASGLAVTPWSQFQPGSPVRIVCGSMAGVEGTLVQLRKHHHLVVSISILQRAVAVEIDSAWCQPSTRLLEEQVSYSS